MSSEPPPAVWDADLSTLLSSLDELTAGARSVFPGRVLLNRKKTHALVERMNEKLLAESKRENVPPFESFTRAIVAVDAVGVLAYGGSSGRSIWRIWFADVSRKRLSKVMEDLHAALAPLA